MRSFRGSPWSAANVPGASDQLLMPTRAAVHAARVRPGVKAGITLIAAHRHSRHVSRRELVHDGVERGLAFESDSRPLRQRQITVAQLRIVGEASEGAEHAGIGFGAA